MKPVHVSALLGLILSGVSAAAQGGAAGPLPTVDQIVSRHIQATGGQAAWDRITTQTRKGIALPGAANLPLETSARIPNQWMFTLRLPNGRTMRHAFDGKEGWEERGAAAKLGADAVLEEGLIYDPFWVLKLKDYFPKTTLKGIETNGDTEVYVIEASPAQGRARILYFDVGTGLLTRAGKVIYSEYRDAGGVKAPHLIRYGWQTMRYSEIRHGEPVEEARFRMPPAPPQTAEEKAPENLPPAGEILDAYLKAAGGTEAFIKLKTQTRKGSLKEGSESCAVETLAKAPGKWLMMIHTDAGGLDREGYDGKAGWSESSDVIKDMNPEEQRELEGLLRFQLPLELDRLRSSMVVKRKEKRGQQEVYVVDVSPAQGRRRTLGFDTQTGLLVQIDSVLLADYREVDSVRVPFTARLHGGQITVDFAEVRHDAAIDDARFERPAPSPAFEKNFAGLEDARAVAVLKRVVGQGVSPSDGRMLHDLIVEKGYKRVLDVGTARGYSSLWFGLAMRKTGGKVVTIEIDPETADEARENFRQAGLQAAIDSRINDALLEIPAIQGSFDFVFMDTGSALNKKLFDLLQARIAPGGAITAHNAGSFESQQPDFLKAVKADPTLETRIVKTSSGGILISAKKR